MQVQGSGLHGPPQAPQPPPERLGPDSPAEPGTMGPEPVRCAAAAPTDRPPSDDLPPAPDPLCWADLLPTPVVAWSQQLRHALGQAVGQFRHLADTLCGASPVPPDAPDPALDAALQSLTTLAQHLLAQQAADGPGFQALLREVFGPGIDAHAAAALQEQLRRGDWAWAPAVEVVCSAALSDVSGQQGPGVARGADASSNETVYLNEALLRSDPGAALRVLLEALGHALDARLNRIDTPGDEGAYFARRVLGEALDEADLQALRDEQDHGVMRRNGEAGIAVEYSFAASADAATATATSISATASLATGGPGGSGGSGGPGGPHDPKRPSGPDPAPGSSLGVPRATPLLLDPSQATLPFLHGHVIRPLWLEQRDAALNALGLFIDAAHQQAQSQGPGGMGWRPFEPAWHDTPDGTARVAVGPQGQSLVWVETRSAVQDSGDSAVVLEPAEGTWWGFCEVSFTAALQAQMQAAPSAALNQLGVLYGVPPQDLLAQRPELWDLARQADRPLHAGPPPQPGVAMGDPQLLLMLDLHLRDPLNQQLIAAFGGHVAEPATALAHEQIRLYGRDRWEQLTRLDQALAAVRESFNTAMAEARAGDGPGWLEVPMQTGVDPDTGQPVGVFQRDADGVVLRGADGQPMLATMRVFSPEGFAQHWLAEAGLAQEAFRALYGEVRTEIVRTEAGQGDATGGFTWVAHTRLSQSPFVLDETGLRHGEFTRIALNDPPRLNDERIVFFDGEAGWVTLTANLHVGRSGLEKAMDVATPILMGGMMVLMAGPLIGWAGGLSSVGGAFIAGASGTIGSSLGATGTVRLKDVVTGGVASVLTLGFNKLVSAQFGVNLHAMAQGAEAGERLRGALGNATIGGAVQELLGGQFKAGFAGGLARGLANEVLQGIDAAIADSPHLTRAEADTARFIGRIVASGIRALASPDDPMRAIVADFLQGFVDEVVYDAVAQHPTGAATWHALALDQPVLDAQGLPVAGAVDPTLPPAAQAEQLAEQLRDRGVSADEAARQAVLAIGRQRGTATPALAPSGPAPSGPAATGQDPPVITVHGRALPRDALGNLYDTDAQGRQVVYLAGGGILALAAPVDLTVSSRLVTPGAALLTHLANAGKALASIARGLSVPTWLVTGGNTTDPVVTQVGPDLRFEQRPGELYGRIYDRMPGDTWVLRTGPERYLGLPQPSGFLVISDDELAAWGRPLSTPAAPSMPPLPPGSADPHGAVAVPGSTPHATAESGAHEIPGFEPTSIHGSDSIVTRDKNAENNYGRAVERHRQNPALQDPRTLIGQTLPGIGTWIAPETPRTNPGADFEEQVTGKPSGIELNVGGDVRITAQGVTTATGGANFDGYRIDNGQVVLVDAKDWPDGFVEFMVKSGKLTEAVRVEARRQIKYTSGTDARIEWQVSSPKAADAIQHELSRAGYGDAIEVIVVPKN